MSKTHNCMLYGCYYEDQSLCLFCGVDKPKSSEVWGKSPVSGLQDAIDMNRMYRLDKKTNQGE